MKAYTSTSYMYLANLDDNYPTTMIIPHKKTVTVPCGTTAYGYTANDGGMIVNEDKTFDLYKGIYFCVPGEASIRDVEGLICLRENYDGIFSMGGPVENTGRLKYINGCSDTVLLAPILLGDPCFNYLYIPANVNQTAHTHPSVRVGYVLEGMGYCLYDNGKFDLIAGTIFMLKANEKHSFHTELGYLKIVVFHPDSDFGPAHETHPMINKTYVDGESLRGDNKYRTINISQ
jgi:mannose-6-phosphate isomerase-like protein (cupin superfamily)